MIEKKDGNKIIGKLKKGENKEVEDEGGKKRRNLVDKNKFGKVEDGQGDEENMMIEERKNERFKIEKLKKLREEKIGIERIGIGVKRKEDIIVSSNVREKSEEMIEMDKKRICEREGKKYRKLGLVKKDC